MPVHNRGTPVWMSTAKPNMANTSRATPRAGRQHAEAVATEQEGARADDAGHADARREQLEQEQRHPDHEQQVGDRRAGDRVHQPVEQRHLGEPGLPRRDLAGLVALL